MIIEDLRGERLKRYRPVFRDLRTGKEEAAEYTISLFPSEVLMKEHCQSTETENVIVKYVQD